MSGITLFTSMNCINKVELLLGIRTLQCILLKVCLLLGVEVLAGVSFEEIVEPQNDSKSLFFKMFFVHRLVGLELAFVGSHATCTKLT